MTGENRPLSQIWKEAADDAGEKDAIARLWEETKSLQFARHCQALGEMPVNRAEQIVKASDYWLEEVTDGVLKRTVANKAKVLAESIKMQYSEHMNDEANHRAEARL
jgi:hypothetical protein